MKNESLRDSPFFYPNPRAKQASGILFFKTQSLSERAIHKQVVMRKIFGGSRSINGAKAHEVNTSVIETQLRQNPGQSFFKVMLPLINQRRSEL